MNAVSGPSPARGCPYGLSGILGAALHRYILCIPGARRLPPDGSAAFTVILCGFKTRLLHRCIVFPERGPKPVLLPESAAPSVAFTERRSSGFFCPLSIFSYQYTGGYGQMQGVFPDIKNSSSFDAKNNSLCTGRRECWVRGNFLKTGSECSGTGIGCTRGMSRRENRALRQNSFKNRR